MGLEDKIRSARSDLILKKEWAWFGQLAMSLKLQYRSDIAVMATDSRCLYYGDGASEYGHDELIFIVAHEVMHCALSHVFRLSGRDHLRWNMAGDYVINYLLDESGVGQTPKNLLLDKQYAGISADEVYQLLMSQQQQQGQGGQQQQQGQQQGRWNIGGMEPAAEEAEEAEKTWQNKAKIASVNVPLPGGALGEIISRIFDIPTGKINWKQLLHRFIDQVAGKEDYTWQRRNHKVSSVYLPGMSSEKLRIAFILDSSGSTWEEFPEFVGELDGLLDQFQAELVTVFCDSKVRATREFSSEDSPLTPANFEDMDYGGGGTDFRPSIEYIEEKEDVKCIVYLTDGIGPYPADCHIPTIWILTKKVDESSEYYPPFGEVVIAKP